MAEQNQNKNKEQGTQDISQLLKVRREKLTNLVEAGNDRGYVGFKRVERAESVVADGYKKHRHNHNENIDYEETLDVAPRCFVDGRSVHFCRVNRAG